MPNLFVDHFRAMLALGKQTVLTNPPLTDETGATNVKGDKSIGMDVQVETILLDYIKQNDLPVCVFSEEIGTVQYHPSPTHLIVFDPLDGSTNYKLGKNFLPHGLLIACYAGTKPKLNNIIAAGAIEYTTHQGWIFDGAQTKTINGEPVDLNHDWIISKSTPVNFDLYYPAAYQAFAHLPGKVHVRWSGSNVGSLTYTLSGVSAAMGALLMRPEEIGTMVALIKGAGGKAVDLHGNDLGEEEFSIDRTYAMIAGDKTVVDFIVNNLSTGSTQHAK